MRWRRRSRRGGSDRGRARPRRRRLVVRLAALALSALVAGPAVFITTQCYSSADPARVVPPLSVDPSAFREESFTFLTLPEWFIVYSTEEYGRFIHGSFGSGKSHVMTMLALLIETAAPAWKKFRPLLNAHRDAQQSKGRDAPEHEAWLSKAKLLVVRIHMLSVRGKTTGFDRAVYEGFNEALKRRGKAPFEFLNVDSIFDEVRREAKEYGDIVWKRLEAENIVGGREDFEALAKRIGFRVAAGLSERVIYKELFLNGLTLLDLKRGGSGPSLTLSHVAARQEVRDLVAALNLPRRAGDVPSDAPVTEPATEDQQAAE